MYFLDAFELPNFSNACDDRDGDLGLVDVPFDTLQSHARGEQLHLGWALGWADGLSAPDVGNGEFDRAALRFEPISQILKFGDGLEETASGLDNYNFRPGRPSDADGSGRRNHTASPSDEPMFTMSGPAPGEDGGEIVVIGIRPNGSGGYGGGTGTFELREPTVSIGNPEEQEPPPPDCTEATFRPWGTVTLDAAEREKIATIGDAIKELLDLIGSLPANGTFSSGGTTITAKEMFELLVQADWNIRSPTYNFNNSTNNFGSVGSADRNGGNPIFSLNEAGLDWGRSIQDARFYILHELSHVTLAGFEMSKAATTVAAKTATEQWANSMALKMYNTLFGSSPTLGNPPQPGYSTATFTYTPPQNPSGETAEQASNGCGG